MTNLRPQDKLFLAILIPIALVAAYIFFWRADTVQCTASLTNQSLSLVAVENFDFEIAQARKQLHAAEQELASEQKIPPPQAKVQGCAEDTPALRERLVHEALQQAGLRVTRSTRVDESDTTANDSTPRADDAATLIATGIRPAPFQRIFEVDGDYPALRKTLQLIIDRKLPVIPSSIVRTSPSHWKLVLTL